MTARPEPNPYESPSIDSSRSKAGLDTAGLDTEARIEQLESRLNKLERRINRSGLLSPNLAVRALVVFGYFMLAYIVIAAAIWGIVGLVYLALNFGQ